VTRVRRALTFLLGMLVLASSCGGSGDADEAQPARPATASVAESAAPALVGRWERVNRCTELVQALAEEGLGAIAPAMVGDYFRGASPEELAQKDDVCAGAEPIVHAHYFDAAGRFGSLDGEEQVDDGRYEIVDDSTFVISKEFPDVTFQYAIEGDTLTITPVVTEAMKREALARPNDFSPAGWATSMSYPGHEWKRVDCGSWC
jgi:hypothetical protein